MYNRDGMDVEKITIQPTEAIVVKIDTDRYDLDTACDLFHEIKNLLPSNIPMIAIPTGIELEHQDIKYIISELEKALK
jgi:predicted nuclease with TOPRIM domain